MLFRKKRRRWIRHRHREKRKKPTRKRCRMEKYKNAIAECFPIWWTQLSFMLVCRSKYVGKANDRDFCTMIYDMPLFFLLFSSFLLYTAPSGDKQMRVSSRKTHTGSFFFKPTSATPLCTGVDYWSPKWHKKHSTSPLGLIKPKK